MESIGCNRHSSSLKMAQPADTDKPSYSLYSLHFEHVGCNTHSTVNKIPKTKVFWLALSQLMLASVQIMENMVVALLHEDRFHHSESKLTLQVIWIVNLCWAGSTVLLLFGIMTNRPTLVIPNFVLLFPLTLMEMIFLPFLLFTASYTFSIFICSITIVMLIISQIYEWKFITDAGRLL